MHHQNSKKSLQFTRGTLGLLVIIAGILLLSFNLGLLPLQYKDVVFAWPTLFLLIGLFKVLQGGRLIVGLIFLAIGLRGVSLKLGIMVPQLYGVSVPVFLILLGLALLLHRRKRGLLCPRHHKFVEQNGTLDKDGRIKINHVFRGSKRKISDTVFKGGEVSCVFGGCEIDLTEAELADGKNYLDISCVFGAVNVIVPENWVVSLDVNAVLGEFVETGAVPAERKNTENMLYISGSCVFGGGEIKYRSL